MKPLGDRASVNRITTLAPNAVDFCIAYRRVNSQKEAFPSQAKPARKKSNTAKAVSRTPPDDYARLLKLLKKEKTLPLKRKGLEGKVKSWFLKLGAAAHQTLVQRLFDERLVAEAGKEIKFGL